MSELSQSPPPEEHELEIEEAHVEGEDDGISTDTSGSLPGSPGADEDSEVPPTTVCKWDGCMQNLRTLDALVRHVHDCISPSTYELICSSYWHQETTIYV